MNLGFRKGIVPCFPSFYLCLFLQNLCEDIARSKVFLIYPSISAAKLRLFSHIPYRQILIFCVKRPYFQPFSSHKTQKDHLTLLLDSLVTAYAA